MLPIARSRTALRLLRAVWYVGERWTWRARGSKRAAGIADIDWHLSMWSAAAQLLGGELTPLGRGYAEIRLGERSTRVYRQWTTLDDAVTLQLAGDKPMVLVLLAAAGIPVPRHRSFTLEQLDRATDLLAELSGPCVVKPALGTGGGRGVTTGVTSQRDLLLAALRASAHGTELLAEEQIQGTGFRLLFLDGELLDAVKRAPPAVIGDGERTVRQLIAKENARRSARKDLSLGRLTIDRECRSTLRQAGLTLGSRPGSGERILVKRATNEGADAESESVRDRICPRLREAGSAAAAAIGARLAGVDVITSDPAEPLEQTGGVIHEVNTTPGLRFHYMASPDEASRSVVAILRRALGDEKESRERERSRSEPSDERWPTEPC